MVGHEPAIRPKLLQQSALRQFASSGSLWPEKRSHKALKGLYQGGIRDVTRLVLVELAGCEQSAGRQKHFVQFVDELQMICQRRDSQRSARAQALRSLTMRSKEANKISTFARSPVQLFWNP